MNGTVNLRWQITDLADEFGNRYGMMMMKTKVASHEVLAGGVDSDILVSVNFVPEKDNLMGSNKTMTISRIAAV